jgi:hypothetical protein
MEILTNAGCGLRPIGRVRNYETGHAVWTKNEARKDELDFLDK